MILRFGKGDYERSEMVIRQLLAEAGVEGIPEGLVEIECSGAEAAADWADLQSLKTYLCYEQATDFNAPAGVAPDQPHTFAEPLRLQLNH